MISHILVPIDDAPLSTRAVPVAGALARLAGATVDLLSVEPVGPPRDGVHERLEEVARLVPPGVGVSTAVVPTTASVARTLAELEHPGGTMLCMATHGRGPLGSLGLGSVTADLVAHAEMPVMVVGPSCTTQSPTDLSGPVVAAVEGSARDDAVVAAAVHLAQVTGSALTLTTAVTRPRDPAAWSQADDVLSAAADRAADLGLEAERTPVAAADAAEGVLRTAAAGAGGIVMGSHRRGRLGRLLFGSTTAHVVRSATCPVLVAAPVPAPDDPPTRSAGVRRGGG